MVSYTTNKGYPVPTVGGDPNLWGAELNSGLGILDKNMGGHVNINVAGSADVTATAAQAQNLSIRLTGALTGSINFILPAVGGFYIIDNSTSGAFSITVITSAGGSTGPVCSQGYKTPVYSDATDVFPYAPGMSLTGIAGTKTNDSTAAGNVGQFISSVVTSPVSIPSNVQTNITTVSLTGGDWDVRGELWVNAPFAGISNQVQGGLSTVSATLPSAPAVGRSRFLVLGDAVDTSASPNIVLPLGPTRMSLAVTTTVYLVGVAGYASGSVSGIGKIEARRMR